MFSDENVENAVVSITGTKKLHEVRQNPSFFATVVSLLENVPKKGLTLCRYFLHFYFFFFNFQKGPFLGTENSLSTITIFT